MRTRAIRRFAGSQNAINKYHLHKRFILADFRKACCLRADRLRTTVLGLTSCGCQASLAGPSQDLNSNMMDAINEEVVHTYDSLEIGDSFSIPRFISEDDVLTFARVTGDDNPLHVDAEYAESTRFGQRVVHGVLLLGLISKVLGRDFPGPGSIAVSLACRFLRPVRLNSEVRVEVRVVEKLAKRGYVKCKTYIYTEENRMALAGEATLIPPAPGGEQDRIA